MENGGTWLTPVMALYHRSVASGWRRGWVSLMQQFFVLEKTGRLKMAKPLNRPITTPASAVLKSDANLPSTNSLNHKRAFLFEAQNRALTTVLDNTRSRERRVVPRLASSNASIIVPHVRLRTARPARSREMMPSNSHSHIHSGGSGML
jgi:hypothetical protein